MPSPVPNPQGVTGRLTAKVGPLPVWGWAIGILVLGFAAYKLFGQSTATATADPTTPTTAPTTEQDTSGNPAADGATPGGTLDVGNLNDTQLDQLGGSVDALTAAILASPGFLGDGSTAGTGATVPNDGTKAAPASSKPAPKPTTPPFGGVLSRRKLKSGSTLITYKSGRVVEMAPGHKPYVVKKGG